MPDIEYINEATDIPSIQMVQGSSVPEPTADGLIQFGFTSAGGWFRRFGQSAIRWLTTADQDAIGFAAYADDATVQDITVSTPTLTTFNQVDFDTGGWWNTSTNHYTPQKAGKWLVGAWCYLDQTPLNSGLWIYKNGTPIAHSLVSGDESAQSLYLARPVVMNGSSDFLSMYCFSSSAIAPRIYKASRLTMFWANWLGN